MFKARMRFSKNLASKFISHLDLMHTLQRSMARAKLPVWFTEGFNPHAYVSVALPLSTGFSSDYEFLDFRFTTEGVPEGAIEALNAALPLGIQALEIYEDTRAAKHIAFSEYEIACDVENPTGFAQALSALFAQESVEVLKKTKRSEAVVNIKELMRGFSVAVVADNEVKITVICAAGNANLSPEYIVKAANKYLPDFTLEGVSYHRTCVFDADMQIFR